MKRSRLLNLSIATMFSLWLGATAGAQTIISINIGYDGTTNFLDSSESAGVVPATNWNNLSHSQGTLTYSNTGTTNGSPSPNSEFYSNKNALVDGSGSTTAIGFEMVGGNISDSHFDDTSDNATDLADPNDDMFAQGFRFDTDTTLQLTGLTGTYDVYLYFADRTTAGNTMGVTNGSTTYYLQLTEGAGDAVDVYESAGDFDEITSTTLASPTVNGDYLVFSNQTGSLFSATPTESGNEATLSGIQVVVIPEPTAGVLIMLSSGLVLLVRRRRRL